MEQVFEKQVRKHNAEMEFLGTKIMGMEESLEFLKNES